jgi:hypothetical protein
MHEISVQQAQRIHQEEPIKLEDLHQFHGGQDAARNRVVAPPG